MKHLFSIIFILMLQPLQAQNIYFNAQVSRNIILIGDTFTLQIEGALDRKCEPNWPSINQYIKAPFTIISIGEIEKATDGYNFIYTQKIKLSCYDSGRHSIAPIPLSTSCDSNAMYTSDSIAVLVNNVKVDMSADIKEEESDEESKGLSPAQKAMIFILAIALLLGTFIFWYYKKYGFKDAAKKTTIAPYKVAIKTLNELKLTDQSEAASKQYYSELTDCIKTFLDAQIKLPILDKTSAEAKAVLMKNNYTKLHANNVLDIFNRADYAKFAKLPPTLELASSDAEMAKNIVTDIYQQHLVQLQKQRELDIANKKKL